MGIGKDEVGKLDYCKEKQEKVLGPRNCTSRCHKGWGGRQCNDIDEVARTEIFTKFWETLTWNEKRLCIVNLVDKKETVKKSTGDALSQRKFSYQFYLRINGVKVKVCQSLFMATFGLRNETVYRWMDEETADHGLPSPKACTSNTDENEAKVEADKYLQDIPKMPSHYCRAQSRKMYLETEHRSIAEVYKHYRTTLIESNKPVMGITSFTKLFKEKNLAIFKPRKDQCDTCCMYKTGNIDEHEYRSHIKRKKDAQQHKDVDKDKSESDSTTKVFTMDLQSLLMCPKLKAGCMYYKTKLCCHNFTLYELANGNCQCYFWNETAADLSASTFASCIIDCLNEIDLTGVESIILYSDGCTYQNRNVVLANALLQWSVQRSVTVEQKFLEKGHTYMECDSIHAAIERKVKDRDIYVPQHYVDIISKAREREYPVKYVNHTFFRDFSKLGFYSSIRPGVGVGSPVVTDIRCLKYCPEGTIAYKINFDDDYTELRKPRGAAMPSLIDTNPPANTRPLKIKKAKYNHLQQIKMVIPPDYHAYYDNLPHDS